MIRELDSYEEEHLEFLTQVLCGNCEGVGRIVSEEWESFYDWCNVNNYDADAVSDDSVQTFWLNKGYGSDPRTWPEAEILCSRCNGTGLIRGSVTIHDIKELLDKNETNMG